MRARRSRSLALALLILPLLAIQSGGNRRGAGFTPATPIWTTSFEEDNGSHSDCTSDDGNPAVAAFGVADCDCDVAGNCSSGGFPDGVEVMRTVASTYSAPHTPQAEGWYRWHYLVESTAGNSNGEIYNGLAGSGWPKVYINHAEQLLLYCPNWVPSSYGARLTPGTWYIFELHWTGFDGVDTTPEFSLRSYVESTLVETLSSPINCTGNAATVGVDGPRHGSGSNHWSRHDCLQLYDGDPGTISTSVCDLRTD